MTLNTETGIDSANDRFVKIKAHDLATFDINDPSTYEVLDFQARWDRQDGAAINGANPRVMYFKRLAMSKETGDHRFQTVTQQEMLFSSDPPGPTSLPVGTFQQIETLVKFSQEELKRQVDVAFNRQVDKLVPTEGSVAAIIEHAGALGLKVENKIVDAEQQGKIDAGIAARDAVAQLRAVQAAFYAAIQADEDYDLSVWLTDDTTTSV